MTTQYQQQRNHVLGNHNAMDNENTNNHMKMKAIGSSSSRMPLRAMQTNVENNNNAYNNNNNNNNKPASSKTTKGPSIAKSSRSSKSKRVEETAPLEIEELRRKPNGEGHTVHRYSRGKMLGKGGFAKVYLCTSMDTNRSYAVKIVPKANLVKSRARQKLQAEIKIHRSLKHKHICEYKHFFEDKTHCYILLELCHNQSMNELIKRRKKLTEPEAKYYLSQLLQAVQFMHNVNVIHRDLKLGNLFLDKHLRVKVGDFGLASKLSASDEKRKTICGTPNYIAPEVIDGNKEKRGHSFEVDVWSMGVIFYTFLIGKPPYESKDVKSTYQRILKNEYSFPSHIPISQHARDLIASMLQTRPDRRPSLETIMQHPFFTHDPKKIPKSLPSCCTHVAPDWQEELDGQLVPVLAEPDEGKYRTKETSSGNRRDEAPGKRSGGRYKDPPARRDTQEKYEYVPTQQASRPSSHRSNHASNKFEIYDDKPDKYGNQRCRSSTPLPQHENHHNFRDDFDIRDIRTVDAGAESHPTIPQKYDDLSDKIQKCVIQDPPTGSNKIESSQSPQANVHDVELRALEVMHQRLKETNAKVVAVGGPTNFKPISQANSPGAEMWVTRYVDYTSKYGLGFLFNDGSAGVYFNDSTKAVLAPKGDAFIYVERKKVGDARMEQIPEHYTLTEFPDALQKKVTLLKHFRNYLIEQHKRDDKSEGNIDGFGREYEGTGDPTVFLKKWVRTKHAILFRLSNQTVQVVFYDHTEILLSSEARVVTYVNKRRGRETYYLADIMNTVEHNDIKKRLKYAEGILQQLISTPKKQ